MWVVRWAWRSKPALVRSSAASRSPSVRKATTRRCCGIGHVYHHPASTASTVVVASSSVPARA